MPMRVKNEAMIRDEIMGQDKYKHDRSDILIGKMKCVILCSGTVVEI
jgi:hypothetical protein